MNTRWRFLLPVVVLFTVLMLFVGGCWLPAVFAPDDPRPTYTPSERLLLRRPTFTPFKTVTPGQPTSPPDVQHSLTLTSAAAAPDTAELADLVVTYHVVIYHACPWDGPGTISLNIQNRGDADAGAFNVTINDQPTRVEGIPAGEAADAVIPFDAGPVGMIRAVVDPEGIVAEADRDNNEFYILFTPPPPCGGTGSP